MAAAALGAVVLVTNVVIARAFPVKPYRIPSESMSPTVELNERILVERVSVRTGDPSRGDIVVFNPPLGADLQTCGVDHGPGEACSKPTGEKSDVTFIKRIVAGPGDRVSITGGRVLIDGEPRDEDYARLSDDCPTCNLRKEITIPPDHWFMMGDNRGESADSREWGPVPKKWIIGRVFFRYWPPDSIGGV
jgi:signal peptidase I